MPVHGKNQEIVWRQFQITLERAGKPWPLKKVIDGIAVAYGEGSPVGLYP
jgi:hypothetical protein